MKVGLFRVGQVAPEVLVALEEGLPKAFLGNTVAIIKEILLIIQNTFNKKHSQFKSKIKLNEVQAYANKRHDLYRIIDVIDVGIFILGLNYVFGEVYNPDSATSLSVWPLKPAFYKNKPAMVSCMLRHSRRRCMSWDTHWGCDIIRGRYLLCFFPTRFLTLIVSKNLLCDECYLQAAIANR
jgi:predicted Zn-dependent protease